MHTPLRIVAVVLIQPMMVLASESPTRPVDPPITATIETTLATGSDQIRQLAFDGDPETFFASAGNPSAKDHFTLVLDKPVAVKSVAVVTGRGDGGDRLEAGILEVSADGKAFEELAKFVDGSARADVKGRALKAVRVRPGSDIAHPLTIREFTIESDPTVAIFRYPVEFAVDVNDAPEMKEWAEGVARLCEAWYPRINEELKSDGYKPARRVTLTLSGTYKGVAEAGGGRIRGSVKYFKDHPDDRGAMIHETVHIVQRYRGRGNPGWLVEGVADYVRFFKFEPGKIGRINPERARYNASYRTSAAFLAYVADKYDKGLVLKLNVLMREGKYKEDVFKELTGKTVQELDEEWRATLGR